MTALLSLNTFLDASMAPYTESAVLGNAHWIDYFFVERGLDFSGSAYFSGKDDQHVVLQFRAYITDISVTELSSKIVSSTL